MTTKVRKIVEHESSVRAREFTYGDEDGPRTQYRFYYLDGRVFCLEYLEHELKTHARRVMAARLIKDMKKCPPK